MTFSMGSHPYPLSTPVRNQSRHKSRLLSTALWDTHIPCVGLESMLPHQPHWEGRAPTKTYLKPLAL